MSTRAILVAATAIAAVMSVQDASALTPYVMDESMASESPPGPSASAMLAPRDFQRLPDEAYEPNPVVADRSARLQCVPFARREAGIEIYGNANTWWAQAKDQYETGEAPAEQSVLVLEGYGGAARGHVAVVREVVSERLIIVDHANWLNGGEITRDVPVRDVSAHGDWSEVQVWHVPGGHWGGRTYNVQGFIHNAVAAAKREAPGANIG